MIIGQPCCCNAPEFMEAKQIILTAPFAGWPEFQDFGSYVTNRAGWVRERYLVSEVVRAGGDGLTQTVTTTADPDNNSTQTNTVTQPGYTGPGGTRNPPVFVSATHWYETFHEMPVGGAYTGRIDYYLREIHNFDDFVSKWEQRLDALVATAAMSAPFQITYEVSNVLRTVTIDFPSAIQGQSQFTHSNRVFLAPKLGFPWSGVLTGQGGIDTLIPNYLHNGQPWVYTPGFQYGGNLNAFGGNGEGAFWSDALNSFYLPGSGGFSFYKCCWALPFGIGCDTPHQDVVWTGDTIRLAVAHDTGIITREAIGLQLAPGIYSFDGRQMIIHSGSRITPAAPYPGLDLAAAVAGVSQSIVQLRVLPGYEHIYYNVLPDSCPP